MTINDNNEVNDPDEVANLFCDHFSSIAAKLDAEIRNSAHNPLNYMPHRVQESFVCTPSSSWEIKKLIMASPNKGSQINSIPVYVYKKISNFISPILCNIFNKSVTDGKFPNILKLARVTPIHKNKSHKIISNFRPISVLSFISKILEKLMKTRAMNFIDTHDLFYDKQFGFRTGYSTTDAILELVDSCTTSLDNKLYTIAVFLDLSKAFDTVNKNIMLNKLERLGFRGAINSWFDSYLSDRQMFVQINDSKSDIKTINIGLPQGAVSILYLFSLYVNDMYIGF